MSDTANEQEAAEPPVKKRMYCVELSATVYTDVEVEAENEDEAHDLAKEEVRFAHSWDDDVSGIAVESVTELEA